MTLYKCNLLFNLMIFFYEINNLYLRLFGEKAAVLTIAVPLHLYFILLKIIVFLS